MRGLCVAALQPPQSTFTFTVPTSISPPMARLLFLPFFTSFQSHLSQLIFVFRGLNPVPKTLFESVLEV